MSQENTDSEDTLQPRPFGLGCVLLTIPPIAVGLVLIAYVALYFAGMKGHPAEGQRVTIAFATCPEARAVMEKRVETMGLAEPQFAQTPEGWTLTATLPVDPTVAAGIPATLIKTGHFEIVDPETKAVIADSALVTETGVHLGNDGAALVVQFNDAGTETVRKAMEAAPEGHIALRIDGEVLREIRNTPAETKGAFQIVGTGNTEAAQVASSAERSVIVGSGVLPCEARVLHVGPSP